MNGQVSLEMMLGLMVAMLVSFCVICLLAHSLASYESGIAAGVRNLEAANQSANGIEGLCWCLQAG